MNSGSKKLPSNSIIINGCSHVVKDMFYKGVIMNNSSKKVLLQKLAKVGNPVFLVKLLNSISSFIKSHQNDHPNEDNPKELYIAVGQDIFLLKDESFIQVDNLPSDCSLVVLSKENYDELVSFLKIDNSEIDLKKLIRSLRKIDNIKRYQEIMKIISPSFSTNMSISQLTQLVVGFI